MTIRSSINAKELNESWSNFERCADEAPAGSYVAAKQIADLVSDASRRLLSNVRKLGHQADACDRIREVEAVMYGYVRDSNPSTTLFMTAEGFGEALGGPARERVLAQAAQSAALFAEFESRHTDPRSAGPH